MQSPEVSGTTESGEKANCEKDEEPRDRVENGGGHENSWERFAGTYHWGSWHGSSYIG